MGLYQTLIPAKIRNWIRPLKDPLGAIMSWLIRIISKNRVCSGPFAGMEFRYPDLEYAMLLGTWELELAEVWELIFANDFSVMVDVGAAEGYYAIGMTYRKPDAKVIAYEMDEHVRNKLNTMKELNGASLEILGKCTLSELEELGSRLEGGFILMDVEGFEAVLLDPVAIPALRHSTILVELHEMYAEGCTTLIEERFLSTHEIRLIKGIKRSLNHLPPSLGFLRYLFPKEKWLGYMDEGRPYEMSWFYITPK